MPSAEKKRGMFFTHIISKWNEPERKGEKSRVGLLFPHQRGRKTTEN